MLAATNLNSRVFAPLAVLVLLGATRASAIDVTLSTGDALGTSSYNSATNWSNGLEPSAGNDYIVGLKWLRSPEATGEFVFGGDSLTLSTGGALLNKNIGVQSLTQNLILDGGYVRSGSGAADTLTLGGTISVTSNNGALVPDQSPYVINADLSGSGILYLLNDDSQYGFGGGSGPGRGIDFSGTSTLTGNVVADAADMVWTNTSDWLFDIGTSGVNNNIAGVGTATFDGTFTLDLAGASSGANDSWQLTDVANQAFGANFNVAGFNQTGPFWTNGTYTFNTSTGILSVGSVEFTEWGVDADGNFSVGTNWAGGVAPTAGDDILFGDVITQDRVVTLDTNASANTIFFSNAGDGDYFLTAATNQTIALTGAAEINTTGRHWLRAGVAGTAGMNLSGGGELVLDAANSFSGGLTINDTNTAVVNAAAIPAGTSITVQNGGELRFWGTDNAFFGETNGTGYTTGTVSGPLSIDGTSVVEVNDGATVSFTGVISGEGQLVANSGSMVSVSATNTYTGVTTVNSGTLTVSNAAGLGAGDGTAATHTVIAGNANTGTLALTGNITVANELLTFGAREGAGSDAVGLSSNGSNTWSGNVIGTTGGTQYNIESTSGTLTLGGTISAPDSAVRNFVFSGAGNINVTGRITDGVVDATGVVTGAGASVNVSVFKRGSGTMTVGTNNASDYWFGNTTVEEGTLVLTANASSDNELFSSVTTVQEGATLNVSSFTDYDLGEGDALGGGGTIQVQTLNIYDDNTITPGDGIGTLKVMGNVLMEDFATGLGSFNYQLGDDNGVIGGAENDLITVSGSLTGANSAGFNIEAVEGSLEAGQYRLISHSGGSPSFTGAVQVVDADGNTLNTRQTLSVTTTTNQVNLNVGGSAANLFWKGTPNNNWSVAGTANFGLNSVGGTNSQFFDLDEVTFGSGATTTTVNVSSAVTPGSITFDSASTYTFTGDGGIKGSGPVNVNAGTVKLQNTGNDYDGTTTVASGARLEIGNASTGDMVVNGTLSVGQASLPLVQGFVYVDAKGGAGGNTTLTDGSTFTPTTNPDWQERTGFANDGQVYQGGSDTANPNEAPVLKTTISGLTPGSSHEIYANYWDADGSTWRILAGTSAGSLTLFDSPADEVAGATDGTDLTTLNYGVAPLITEGNRVMWGASLGTVVADANGEIAIFVDETGTADGDDRTWYDGVSYSTQVLAGETLSINGDLTLSGTSMLELNIGTAVWDSLSVTGQATLDGEIAVDFVGDSPANGTQYTVLTADGGIATPLGSLDFGAGLPSGFTASYNEAMTDLILTFSAGLLGDFNGDGTVNIADYTVWRNNLGADDMVLAPGSTEDGSGIVDVADYDTWKANFGATNAGAIDAIGAANVPEPRSIVLLAGIVGCGVIAFRRRS